MPRRSFIKKIIPIDRNAGGGNREKRKLCTFLSENRGPNHPRVTINVYHCDIYTRYHNTIGTVKLWRNPFLTMVIIDNFDLLQVLIFSSSQG